MKAKLILENIDFKRGMDSKESLGVGYEANFVVNSESYINEIVDTLNQLNSVKIWPAHDRRDQPGMGNLLMEAYMEYYGNNNNYENKGSIKIYKKEPRFRCTLGIYIPTLLEGKKIMANTKDEFIREFVREIIKNQETKIVKEQKYLKDSKNILKKYES